MAKMTDDELLVLIQTHEANSIGNSANASGVGLGSTTPQQQNDLTTVEIDRYNALNFYNARPFGNEQTDRSQVVLPELRDTVEWMLPQLMRMYAGTSRICSFDPVKPGDEAFAEQETDVVNYVFLKQNNGFNLLYDAFKDALLLKNYYFKAGWEKKKHVSIEGYTDLTRDELVKIFVDAKENGDELEVLEQETKQSLIPGLSPPLPVPTGAPSPQQAGLGQPQAAGPQSGAIPGAPLQPQNPAIDPSSLFATIQAALPQPTTTYDIKLRRTTYKGQVVVECCPPEDMRISARARSDMNESPYTAFHSKPTRSELIEMGFDKAIVDSIPKAKPSWVEMDKLARDSALDEMTDPDESDPSVTPVELKECYLRVDYDGDGVAELRRVLVGGSKILENEEVPFVAFSSGVPCRMSHRHIGVSLYDMMGDLQMIKSMLFRQTMDNIYLKNNTRTAVNNQTVNLDDLLTNRPGGIVRVNGAPGMDIMPLEVGDVTSETAALMDRVDSMRTMRTGVGANTLGLDPDALQNITAANGAAALSAAQLKIEMIALLLGDGLKDLFLKIHALLIMHQDQKLDVQLRGEWIEADPSQWKTRTSVTLNIGLGSGNRQELRANAMALAGAQQQAAAMGLVGPKQAYNTAIKLLEGLGWENGHGNYFMSPDSPEYAQAMQAKQQSAQQAQASDPKLALARFKAQSDAQLQQAEAARESQQITLQAQKDSQQSQQDAQIKLLLSREQSADQMKVQTAKALLGFIEGIVEAALKAQSTPATIESDVAAAAQAGRQIQ